MRYIFLLVILIFSGACSTLSGDLTGEARDVAIKRVNQSLVGIGQYGSVSILSTQDINMNMSITGVAVEMIGTVISSSQIQFDSLAQMIAASGSVELEFVGKFMSSTTDTMNTTMDVVLVNNQVYMRGNGEIDFPPSWTNITQNPELFNRIDGSTYTNALYIDWAGLYPITSQTVESIRSLGETKLGDIPVYGYSVVMNVEALMQVSSMDELIFSMNLDGMEREFVDIMDQMIQGMAYEIIVWIGQDEVIRQVEVTVVIDADIDSVGESFKFTARSSMIQNYVNFGAPVNIIPPI